MGRGTAIQGAVGTGFPDTEAAWQGLGKALYDQHRPAAAVAAFTRAAALGRSPALAHYHRAIAHPLAGDFADGWRDYAARLAVPALRPRAFDRPRADGTPLRGRRPLVICERGYGDVFQFIRLLSAPRGQRGAVVFECPQELRALLAPLVAGIDVLPLTAGARRFAVVSADADFPAGDTRARYSKP